MSKDQVIAKLREQTAALQRGGIQHLHLFGSYARGTAVQDVSDVDLMADFDSAKRLTLFDKAGLEVELGEMLQAHVDLSDRATLKEPVRLNAEREAILVFRDPLQSLRDILDAIASIEEFTAGMGFEEFRSDAKTVAAVERKLLVISEAAIRLGDQGPELCPDQPWPKIRGTGNWIRHQYERINLEDIWRTVAEDLPALRASAGRAVARRPA